MNLYHALSGFALDSFWLDPPEEPGAVGDHGRGVVRDQRVPYQAVAEQHPGVGGTSRTAGMTRADNGGGSSGVLWGERIGDATSPDALRPFVAVFEGGTATDASLGDVTGNRGHPTGRR